MSLTQRAATRLTTASRLMALAVGALIIAPCIAVSLTALDIPALIAVGAAIIITGAGVGVAHARAPADLALLPHQGRLLFVLWLLLAAGAVFKISTLALFIDDVAKTQHAFQRNPRPLDNTDLTKPFYLTHNCATCYVVAAHLASVGAENIYDRKHYRAAQEKTPVHETIGAAFHVDQYQYPPPFLLGPYFAYAAGLDFFQLRALWFALSVGLFVLTSGALTVWIRGWGFNPLWLIWPALFLTPVTIATLQMGNVHAFMILISILAMVLFEKQRYVLGGSLLAYAILSKFFPGLLLVYLIFRRRWRACGWTAAAAVVLCGITFAVFGAAPYRAFFNDQLPALASGEAFAFAFRLPPAILANSAVMGVPLKLDALGLTSPWNPVAVARGLTWIYTLVAVTVAAIVGHRQRAIASGCAGEQAAPAIRLHLARTWVALLVLAQLRSPFLPSTYGNIAILVLLALLLPSGRMTLPRLALVGLGFWGFGLVLPLPFGPASSAPDFIFSLVATAVAVALAVGVAMRRLRQ